MTQERQPTVTLTIDGQRRAIPFMEALQRISQALSRKDHAGAERDLRALLSVFPTFPEGHALLGIALGGQNKLADAIKAYREALRLKPVLPQASRDLAALHLRAGDERRLAGDQPGAIEQYRLATTSDPGAGKAWNALGAMLVEAQHYAEAGPALERAWQLDGTQFTTAYNLGNLALSEGDPARAESWFSSAIELNPRFALAHTNLAIALQAQDRLAEALAAIDRALAIDGDLALGHANRGVILDAMRRREEAIEAHERAFALDPTRVSALAMAIHDRQMNCAWDGIEEQFPRVLTTPAGPGAAVPPLLSLGMPCTPEAQRRLAEEFVRVTFAGPVARPATAPGDRERIRLGYISYDYRNHAIAHLIAELFELHDRRRYEVTLYSTGPDDASTWRRRVESAGDLFRDLRGTSAAAAAEQIRADNIDLLIDVNGHTQGSHMPILLRRPAPIQVHYLGYPGTIAAPFVDYLIADPFVAPETERAHFAEPLALLPDTYQVNDRKRPRPASCPTRAELGLPEQGFVFCCFNNAFKILPETFDVWMRILVAVPDSMLWLIGFNEPMQRNLCREAEHRGISASRLVFAGWATQESHLARFRAADLFLDTWPYGGHTTVSEALWMGLPVLTLPGRTFASRVAGSLIGAAGDTTGIAGSVQDYQDKAIGFARDRAALAAWRMRLADVWQNSALFDTPRFTRHLESAFATMVERHRRGERPRTFSVEPL